MYSGVPVKQAFLHIEMINKAGNLCWGMAGIEPTPSKAYDWTPLSPCQLGQGWYQYMLACAPHSGREISGTTSIITMLVY